MNRDPIEYAAEDSNLYMYCKSNPALFSDPSGESPIAWLWWFFNCGDKAIAASNCKKWTELSKKYTKECAEETKGDLRNLLKFHRKYSDCGQISKLINNDSLKNKLLCCIRKKFEKNGDDMELFEKGDSQCLKAILKSPLPPGFGR